MAPFVPYHVSAGSSKIVSFGGLLTTEFLEPPPGRGFHFRQTYKPTLNVDVPPALQRLLDSALKPQGPPAHMHRYQREYFSVESGVLGVRIDGVPHTKTAADGEWSVKAGTFHSFFRHPDYEGPMTVHLSASDSGMDYKLDRVFFENWYGYWHDALLHHGKMNYIQWLAIYDAGDAYPDLPTWLPCRRTLSYWNGVVVGRWLGGLLGYKPFFKEYTTDWDYAVAKMKRSFFQKRLVQDSYSTAKSWEEQVKLSSGPKPTNAEYESWTTDLSLNAKEDGNVKAIPLDCSITPTNAIDSRASKSHWTLLNER